MSDIEEMKHHPRFITLKVKSFAILREIIGKEQMTLKLPTTEVGTTVADLRVKIFELYPEIAAQRIPVRIAVNARMVDEKSIINDFDEIALLPPISGG